MELDLTLRIVLKKPPAGVDFGIQSGKGSGYTTISVRRSTGSDLPLECSIKVMDKRDEGPPRFLGPVIQGPPTARFLYIDVGTYAGQSDTDWSRRIKVPLDGISWKLIEEAKSNSRAVLEARIPGTDGKGRPSCGTVKPVGGWKLSGTRHKETASTKKTGESRGPPRRLPTEIAKFLRDRGTDVASVDQILGATDLPASIRQQAFAQIEATYRKLKAMRMPKKPHPHAKWCEGQWWTPENCYEDAFKFLLDIDETGVLIHGNVKNSQPDQCGKRCDHAWVEIKRGSKWFVIDRFAAAYSNEPMARSEYYRTLDAKPEARYTFKEACRLVGELGRYEAWHKTNKP